MKTKTSFKQCKVFFLALSIVVFSHQSWSCVSLSDEHQYTLKQRIIDTLKAKEDIVSTSYEALNIFLATRDDPSLSELRLALQKGCTAKQNHPLKQNHPFEG